MNDEEEDDNTQQDTPDSAAKAAVGREYGAHVHVRVPRGAILALDAETGKVVYLDPGLLRADREHPE